MIEIMTIEERGERCLSAYVDLADSAFIAEKGRTGSLLLRYPGIFQPENHKNLFGAWEKNLLLATVAVKEVPATHGQAQVRLAMVGLVSVRRSHRGSGVGSAIMASVSRNLVRGGFDLAVLWAASAGFYQRLGWVSSDFGVLGRVTGGKRAKCRLVARRPSELFQEIEGIRTHWLETRLQRTSLDYQVIPPSAEEVICVMTGMDVTSDAYAIVGLRGDVGFIYEIVGNPASFHFLWDDIHGRFGTVFVNDCTGSISMDWLMRNTAAVWSPQSLAMLLSADTGMRRRQENIHVPFFDRI